MKTLLIYPLTLLMTAAGFSYTVKEIVDKCNPSVVQVVLSNDQKEELGIGSGFIIGPEMVATCYHVVAGGASAHVKTAEDITYPVAGVVVADKEHDIAVLKVKRLDDLPALPLGDARKVTTGEPVVALGSPLGLGGSVTEGVVSKVREFEKFGDVIQVSCAVSPGNSGGPLLNAQGEVIGIVSFSLEAGQNLNFGIVINTLQELLKNPPAELIALKTLKKGGLVDDPLGYGVLEPVQGQTSLKVPRSAPYTVAPFMFLEYVPDTLTVASCRMTYAGGLTGPTARRIYSNIKPLTEVKSPDALTGQSYLVLPNTVLQLNKAMAGKEILLTFTFRPKRLALALMNADAAGRHLRSTVKRKLAELGYEVVDGAQVDAAIAAVGKDDPDYSARMAKDLNCAELMIIDCYRGIVGLYDLNNDRLLGNLAYEEPINDDLTRFFGSRDITRP